MVLSKRYCVEYVDGTIECFREGFWYSDKGIIIKWAILGAFFLFFFAWFVGGYIHAKRRLRKGQPLLAYHRWLISYSERKKHGQVPQNQFSFYQRQQPYSQQQRPDGTWSEPPPMYNSNDAPPGYVPPPRATKMNPNHGGMEMPPYGTAPPEAYAMGPQPTGANGDVESQGQNQQLTPRPQQAKMAFTDFVSRFRR